MSTNNCPNPVRSKRAQQDEQEDKRRRNANRDPEDALGGEEHVLDDALRRDLGNGQRARQILANEWIDQRGRRNGRQHRHQPAAGFEHHEDAHDADDQVGAIEVAGP
jgi:hypothetical protein